MTCPDDLDEPYEDDELFTDDETYDLNHPARPPVHDVITDLADYQPRSTAT